MSDLQIGLILLGLVLILIVMLFNWWQDRRARTHMHRQFSSNSEDALLASSSTRREPVLARVVANSTEEDEVDPQCEVVIDISLPQAIAAESLAPALENVLRASSHPIRIFALKDEEGQRANLQRGDACIALQFAVLLANRHGALSAIAWSRVWTQAQALATQFDGIIDGPEQDQVIQKAEQLDALCASLDTTVNLQLRLAQPTSITHIRQQAQALGFAAQGQHMVWLNADQQTQFMLLFHADRETTPQQLTHLDLVLDVPNSPVDTTAFSYMAAVGRDLAQRIQAVLLDDQGQTLTADADATIDTQLRDIVQRLTQAGFTPGSARCARVFS